MGGSCLPGTYIRGVGAAGPETTASGSQGLRGCPPWQLSWTQPSGPAAILVWEPRRKRGPSAGKWGPDQHPMGAPSGSSFPQLDAWSGASQELQGTKPSMCFAAPWAWAWAAEGLWCCLGHPIPFGPLMVGLCICPVGRMRWRAEKGGECAPRLLCSQGLVWLL